MCHVRTCKTVNVDNVFVKQTQISNGNRYQLTSWQNITYPTIYSSILQFHFEMIQSTVSPVYCNLSQFGWQHSNANFSYKENVNQYNLEVTFVSFGSAVELQRLPFQVQAQF